MEIYKKIQFLFISGTVFSYHMLMSTYLSSTLAGQSISLLVAPTYFAFAIALLGSFLLRQVCKSLELNFYLSFLTLLSFIFSILLINFEIKKLMSDILQLGSQKSSELHFLEFYISTFYTKYSITISILTSLPFLAYGLYFSNYFDDQQSNAPLKTLGLELMGGVAGVILSLILLNYLGWEKTFLSFFGLACVGSLVFFNAKKKYIPFFLTLILLIVTLMSKNFISPVSNLHISGRDFSTKLKVELLRESWNSFSKVQTLKLNYDFPGHRYSRKVISIADGTGHAQMPGFHTSEFSITSEITTLFKPKNVLILFAGAGYEIIKMSESLNPPDKITGVEINSHVIEHGRLDSDGAMTSVLKNRNYQLVQSDSRQFLEKSTDYYDAILFSWSGASVAYYSGAIMHTTQFVFTREAFLSAFQKLAPGGHLIIFGGSKVNIVAHMQALGIKNLKSKLSLLVPRLDSNWKRSWDNDILIVAKDTDESGYFKNDLIKLSARFGYSLVISPSSETNEKYLEIESLIQSNDAVSSLKQFNIKNQVNFKSHTDDNPFIYQMFPNYSVNEISNIKSQLLNLDFGFEIKDLILFVGILSMLGLLLTNYFNQSLGFKEKLAPSLGFFFGIFSTSLLLFSIYKSVLYLGFPNFALGLGILISMSSSLFCIYLVQRIKLDNKKFLVLQITGSFLFLGLIVISQIEMVKHYIFQIPFVLQAVLLYFIFFITFSLNSLFYPYLIFQNQKNLTLTKQIIAFDVLGSGFGSLILPLLIEDDGVSLVMLISVGVMQVLILANCIFKKSRFAFN